MTSLKVVRPPSEEYSYTNYVYTTSKFKSRYVEINGFIFIPQIYEGEQNTIALNPKQRACTGCELDKPVIVREYSKLHSVITEAKITITPIGNPPSIDTDYITENFHRYQSHIIKRDQSIFFKAKECVVVLRFDDIKVAAKVGDTADIIHSEFGRVDGPIEVEYVCSKSVKLLSTKSKQKVFKQDIDLKKLGIGGLGREFEAILRRAFTSRILAPELVKKMDISHVKGILLYGPPGCGKTLMARKIGEMLNCAEVRIVNGPEILSKYVGQSEANAREIFSKARSNPDGLHLIVFDECDSLFRARDSRDSTGTAAGVVNQILGILDGVDPINNVIVMGMTNRKDLIDEALLRPGRLEVHIEIGLPNDDGRKEILDIHLAKLKENNLISSDVSIEELVTKTKNYTGAEIKGLVEDAKSYAISRDINPSNLSVGNIDPIVTRSDFLLSAKEIKPLFGSSVNDIDIVTSTPFDDRNRKTFIDLLGVINSTDAFSTVLISGKVGSGKTKLACHASKESQVPFIRMITHDHLIGLQEQARCSYIYNVFDKAQKSFSSIVIIDNIEAIVEWNELGCKYNNSVLQTILTLMRKPVALGKKLTTIITTSDVEGLAKLGILKYIQNTLEISIS